MSISINKNEIIHMDEYYRDRKRDTFKPLIQNMAEDMMENGFTNVGPQITKISISDDSLTQYIDEFIAFYYDSSVGNKGLGASGIDLFGQSSADYQAGNSTFTTYFLDGETGNRTKKIDDVYDDADWHDNISKNIPARLSESIYVSSSLTHDKTSPWSLIFNEVNSAAGAPIVSQSQIDAAGYLETDDPAFLNLVKSQNWGQVLGPNSELFSYLNPHPNRRGSTAAIRTATASADATVTSDGLSAVAGIPFGSGWKDVMDIAATNSSFGTWPVQTGGAKEERGVRTDPRPLTLKDGHFYKKTPPIVAMEDTGESVDNTTSTSTGDKKKKVADSQKGYIGLPQIAKAIYVNEYNKVKMLCTHSSRGVVMRPEAVSGINTRSQIRNYRQTVSDKGPDIHDFWISNYQDENFFPAGTVEPKKFKGEMMIGFDPTFEKNIFQTGDVYTFTFTHTDASGVTSTVPVSVKVLQNSVAGFTKSVFDALSSSTLCDPKDGLYDIIDEGTSTPKRNGVISFESKNIGHNLTSTVTRVERVTSAFTNNIQSYTITDNNTSISTSVNNGAGGANIVTPTYENGYVHEIQLRGFDGANNDDQFEFTLSGLIDELPNGGIADLTNVGTRFETIVYSTPIALNSGQLTANIAAKIRTNAYINKFMEVVANSNAITIRYNRNSSGFMKKGETGKTHGLLAGLAAGSIAASSANFPATTTIGGTNSIEMPANGFAVHDLPSVAQFSVVGIAAGANIQAQRVGADGQTAADPVEAVYLGATLNGPNDFTPAKSSGDVGFDGDPFNYGGDVGNLDVIQAGLGTAVSGVRLEFPLARDLGTFGNPVHGKYAAYVGAAHQLKTSYFCSYEQMVLSSANRPRGPEISFDGATSKSHPNVTHGGTILGRTEYTEFEYYSHEIPIETFEYITDFSMGPIVLETNRTHKLSGYPTGIEGASEGDQPWRIRLDITRGHEIQEASPYVSDTVLQVKPDQDNANSFEYLQVHVATEFQIKGDGTVSSPEGRDGIKMSTIREPGHLGGLRPQYKGYIETAVHKVNPFVTRSSLDSGVESGFNFNSGMVGMHQFNDSHELFLSYAQPFLRGGNDGIATPLIVAVLASSGNNYVAKNAILATDGTPVDYFDANVNSPAGAIPLKSAGSTKLINFDSGILFDGEYRFEERYLSGTSTELTHDTPYNNGQLRLQKGLFRRTGKSDPKIAPAYPMSYHMTIADQGIAFYLRDQASADQSDDNAFFVVQRHVHSSPEVGTGTTANPQFPAGFVDQGIDGSDHQPIHCVYQASESTVLFSDVEPLFTKDTLHRRTSIANMGLYDLEGNKSFDFVTDELELGEIKAMDLSTQGRFRRFVVREKDVLKPWDRHVFAGVNERDSTSIINPLEQLSLNDRGKLVIQFPNRLGSQRFMYTGRELDLIGFCAAGAVGQDTLISSDRMSTGVEGGTGSTGDARRLYRGMMSTGAYGNGMRILLLVAANTNGDSSMETTADTRLLDN